MTEWKCDTHVDFLSLRFYHGDSALFVPCDVSYGLDDGAGIESVYGNAGQQGCEKEKVSGADNDLRRMRSRPRANSRKVLTTLQSVVSSVLRRLVAPHPLPRTTMVFLVGSGGN